LALSSVIFAIFQGLAELSGIGWRLGSELGGGGNRNQGANSNGIGWRLAPEYAALHNPDFSGSRFLI